MRRRLRAPFPLLIAVSTAVCGPLVLADGLAPRPHVVIAPERFREALEPYLAWRAGTAQNDGVVFVSLESMLNERGVDDPDSPEVIKRVLYERWRTGRVGTCLLVGDGDTLPVRFMALDRAEPTAANWAFYPSDLYYADLAKADGAFEDWNSRRDDHHARYFGEVHGESSKSGPINADVIDHDPEIALGRWPVSTPDGAAAIALKTIAYEQSLDAAFAASRAAGDAITSGTSSASGAVFFAVGGWVDVRERARRVTAVLDPAMVGGARALVHDDDATSAPDAEAMKRALRGGTALLLHTGHGQPWGWEQCLSREIIDAAGVTPGTRPPILFSAGCSTAEWTALPPYCAYRDESGVDHTGTNAGERFASPPPPPAPIQRGEFDRTSLSEQLLRQPHGGAIAVIGCSTGSQPCAVSLLEGFASACAELAHEDASRATVGVAWRRALLSYRTRESLDALVPTESWYPPSIFFQGMKFVLLGDPSLRLPLRAPAQ